MVPVDEGVEELINSISFLRKHGIFSTKVRSWVFQRRFVVKSELSATLPESARRIDCESGSFIDVSEAVKSESSYLWSSDIDL